MDLGIRFVLCGCLLALRLAIFPLAFFLACRLIPVPTSNLSQRGKNAWAGEAFAPKTAVEAVVPPANRNSCRLFMGIFWYKLITVEAERA
jgi:hypothetical protein